MVWKTENILHLISFLFLREKEDPISCAKNVFNDSWVLLPNDLFSYKVMCLKCGECECERVL